MNQYLPIVSTINFDNDINNNVDHLLYSLKSYKKVISSIGGFYNIMGLQYDIKDINNNLPQIGISDYVKLYDGTKGVVKAIGKIESRNGEMIRLELDSTSSIKEEKLVRRYDIQSVIETRTSKTIEYDPEKYATIKYNPAWIPVINQHRQFLYQATSIENKSLLERLCEEIGMEIFSNEYKVLSSKFKIITYPSFNYYSIHTTNEEVDTPYFKDTECRIINEDDKLEIIDLIYGEKTLHKGDSMNTKTLSIEVRNKKLFGCDKWIKMQKIEPHVFAECCQEMYDALNVEGEKAKPMITSNNLDINESNEDHILNTKYVLLFNDQHHEAQIKDAEMRSNGHRIYEFDDIDNMYFMLPFQQDLNDISIYIQFEDNYDWILFKQIQNFNNVKEENEEDQKEDVTIKQLHYLFETLKTFGKYDYIIDEKEEFYKEIGIKCDDKHIEIMMDKDSKFYNSLFNNYDEENMILDILIERLEIYQLCNILQQYEEQQEEERERLLQLAEQYKFNAEQLLRAQQMAQQIQTKIKFKLGESVKVKGGYKGKIRYIGRTHKYDGHYFSFQHP